MSRWKASGPIVFLAIMLPLQADDQVNANHVSANQNAKHHKYKVQLAGGFGGPSSSFATGPANFFEKYFNSKGTIVGLADTAIADPLSPFCFYADCLVTNGYTLDKDGKLTALTALPGSNNSSVAYGINAAGMVAGVSSTGSFDATGFPETHAVVWIKDQIIDLGTLGGASSQAFAVNDSGEVIGVAANNIPDQYSGAIGPCTGWACWTVPTQQRAFRWKEGELSDLGTLGGSDAVAYFLNNRGQIAGVSFTNTPTTGNPTQDPFLWERGIMYDLGSLGGTYGAVAALNNRCQVAGVSNLAGDQSMHPFLWDSGRMIDLGTLGGDSAIAYSLSYSGAVAGQSQLSGDAVSHAFLWNNGTMTDLAALFPSPLGNSGAYDVNSSEQVVGFADIPAAPYFSAILWENGDPMVDLNALVENPPATGLHLIYAYAIKDSGEILALAALPTGEVQVALLLPDGQCNAKCEAAAGLVTGVTTFSSAATGGKGGSR
jgi:probable HAF family extracellular repeat protein